MTDLLLSVLGCNYSNIHSMFQTYNYLFNRVSDVLYLLTSLIVKLVVLFIKTKTKPANTTNTFSNKDSAQLLQGHTKEIFNNSNSNSTHLPNRDKSNVNSFIQLLCFQSLDCQDAKHPLTHCTAPSTDTLGHFNIICCLLCCFYDELLNLRYCNKIMVT